jgi:lipocalin
MMGRTTGFLVLALVGGSLARAQTQARVSAQENQTVDFCELVRHPEQYDDKKVKVTATYAPSFHTALFVDDACKKSRPYEEVTANARFANGESGTAAFKKLDRFLRKYRIGSARVTMIAIFRDPLLSGIIEECSGCSEYMLEVEQILAVERIEPPRAKSIQNY